MNASLLIRGFRVTFCAAALLMAALSGLGSARAADATWSPTPADNDWNDAANWDVLPAPGDSLIFGLSAITTLNNDFAAGTQFNNITFDASATSSYTLGGSGIVLGTPVTGAPSSGNITNSSAILQTITLGLTLGAGDHIIDGGVGGLALNPTGGLLRNPGAIADFTGTVTTTTISNSAAGILGGWATFGGTDWATVDGSGNIVAYSAYTDVASGAAMASDPTSNVRITSPFVGPVTLAAPDTTTINTLTYALEGSAQVVDLAGNTLRLGAQGGILVTTATAPSNTNNLTITGGTLTAGGADGISGEIVLNTSWPTVAGNTAGLNIAALVADNNGGGAVSLIKTGRGPAALTGTVANTYTGGTYINEGRFQATNGATYGTGPVTVQSGGQAFFGTGTWINDFFIQGIGTQNEAGTGAIRGGGTITGMITLLADARISGTPTITGQITDGANSFSMTFGSTGNVGSAGTNLTISNPTNDWDGNTVLVGRTGGTAGNTVLSFGADEVIPNGVGKGNMIINENGGTTASLVTLNLNGFNETINGLASGAGNAVNTFVTNNNAGAAPSLLTLGDNNATAAFAGAIQDGTGTVAVTKIGSGTQTFSGANTYTGDTTVLGGTLSLTLNGLIADTSNVVLDGGTLDLSFIGTDTMGALFIGGTPAELGTWGRVGSGAMHESSFITGNGLLLVTVPEPGVVALALLGISVVLLRVRRRRRMLA